MPKLNSVNAITSLGFKDVKILRSMETNKIACLDATVTVNGKVVGRETIEPDTITTVAGWNNLPSFSAMRFKVPKRRPARLTCGLSRRVVKTALKPMCMSVKAWHWSTFHTMTMKNCANRSCYSLTARQVVTEPRVKACGDLTISFQATPTRAWGLPLRSYGCTVTGRVGWDPVNLLGFGTAVKSVSLPEGVMSLAQCWAGWLASTNRSFKGV